jgi:polyisoprenyl-teichoic acid--peptidoglycan teichoic acid transferase
LANTDRSRSPLRNPSATAGKASVRPGGTSYGGGRGRPPANGRARSGDVLPPAKVKRRKPIGSVLLIMIGVLFVVISGGTYFTVHTVIQKVSDSIPQQQLLGSAVSAEKSIDGVINFLLIGVDTRPGNTIGSRSDSIIIVHIPADHQSAYLVSIPRDTRAAIPGHGEQKINAAFYYGSSNGGGYSGGAQLLSKTLQADYGLQFNGAAIVSFSGFEDIVTALGGVTMYVDERTPSLHHGYKIVNGKKVNAAPFVTHNKGLTWSKVPGVTDVVYQKGTQHLTAYEALDFVRQRDNLQLGDGDYGRERHQQQFIKAAAEEAIDKGLSNPLTGAKFLTPLLKSFILDPGKFSLTDWIFTLKGISPSSMITIQTNDGTYNSQKIDGQSYEILSPTSMTLLDDVKTDSLAQFVAAHPTWVSTT